jgi:hypothetical protein
MELAKDSKEKNIKYTLDYTIKKIRTRPKIKKKMTDKLSYCFFIYK